MAVLVYVNTAMAENRLEQEGHAGDRLVLVRLGYAWERGG